MADSIPASAYLIFRHKNVGPWKFLLSILGLGGAASPIVASSADLKKTADNLLVAWLSLFVMLILESLHLRLRDLGSIIETFLNVLSLNGGLWNVLCMTLKGSASDIVWPNKESANYRSIIGHLDWRTQLAKDPNAYTCHEQADVKVIQGLIDGGNEPFSPQIKSAPKSRILNLADLCMMSSKLAYENEEFVKRVVTETWNMNFVGMYNCWNEAQQVNATGVFMATDKQEDAEVIVVAFRGTEPFNTFNWVTDFDFSWYKLGELGQVHVGVLEALGLGSRYDLESLAELQRRFLEASSVGSGSELPSSISGLPLQICKAKLLANDVVTKTLRELIQKHKNAKIFITGHSLGGALACLYSAILVHCSKCSNYELSDRLEGVYTFGQPRVGDDDFVKFYNEHLTQPVNRYFRVVYNNDVVPRVPSDDPIFRFKHAGMCCYFNSVYYGKLLKEAPNRNYFSLLYYLPMTISAVWEFFYNTLISPHLHGDDYIESGTSTIFRMFGILFPGVGSHSPVNYVNSVRLGLEFDNQALL